MNGARRNDYSLTTQDSQILGCQTINRVSSRGDLSPFPHSIRAVPAPTPTAIAPFAQVMFGKDIPAVFQVVVDPFHKFGRIGFRLLTVGFSFCAE